MQEEQISLYQDKIKAIHERLDIAEQKLVEYASMPDIEEQLKDRMEALAAAQVMDGWIDGLIDRRIDRLADR